MSALILYYSYSGNTRKIAEQIHKLTGAELAEIKTVTPYPASYDACVKQAKNEVEQNFAPEVQPLGVNLADYDTIYLGTPAWWYTFAPPLRSVLSAHTWQGKTLYPFVTHGGGPGGTVQNLQDFCKGAAVKDGLEVYFSKAAHKTSEAEIKAWLEQ